MAQLLKVDSEKQKVIFTIKSCIFAVDNYNYTFNFWDSLVYCLMESVPLEV